MHITQNIMTLLRGILPHVRDRYGITRLGVFGSVARWEQNENSDVDVSYEGRAKSVCTIVSLQCELVEILRFHVDPVGAQDNMIHHTPCLDKNRRAICTLRSWLQAAFTSF